MDLTANNLIAADHALKLMDALVAINEAIATTNNGKLMIMRIENDDHRKLVPELVSYGALNYARFINLRDSVCAA